MFLYPTNGYRRVQSTRISQYHCCHVFTPLYINRTSCWASRVGAGAAEMWGWGPCGCPPYLIGELLSWPDSPRAATRAYTCPPDRMPPTSAPLPPLRAHQKLLVRNGRPQGPAPRRFVLLPDWYEFYS